MAESQPSPFAGLDYPHGERPSASLGSLAKDLRELHGVRGAHALAAAVLLDQGRAREAFELLDKAVSTLEAEAEAARVARQIKRARGEA